MNEARWKSLKRVGWTQHFSLSEFGRVLSFSPIPAYFAGYAGVVAQSLGRGALLIFNGNDDD
jgi:hypothetical protein